ncbi:PLP-dependent aminotransferase family protein [Effusibacillus consociatus]|uniref:PLP-dependent aminotransferase family protein n=1 Tax=Effusibacillus consociatus TaxID=1117041 RepID=A0ABV9PX01_9BACL
MNYLLSETAQNSKVSAVREILKLTQGSSVISFAGGLPAEEFFPIEALDAAFERVFEQGKKSLQYGLTEGYTPLREQISVRMSKKGIHADPSDMLLTTGSQQAIDLLARVYLEPGDVVLVENPTYLAALQVFHYYRVQVVSIRSDRFGMDLDDLSRKIDEYNPKMVYVTPTFSNPTGKVWSKERRKGLLEIGHDRNVLILEDDPYGELQFRDDVSYPTIFSMDQHPNGAVLYTSTFSKTVVPALRTGWVVGDPTIIQAMTRAKQAADLHSSSLDQQALYQLMTHFDLDAHIQEIRSQYRQRMELMSQLLHRQPWTDIRWNEPEGGMFLWMELPSDWNAETLLQHAVKEGVAFVPGTEFYVGTPQSNTLRLNFTHTSPENMAIGMERLARAVNSFHLAHV